MICGGCIINMHCSIEKGQRLICLIIYYVVCRTLGCFKLTPCWVSSLVLFIYLYLFFHEVYFYGLFSWSFLTPQAFAFLFKYSAVVSTASLCFVLQLLWSGTLLTPTQFSLWMCSSSPVIPMERAKQSPALPRATEVSVCMSLSPKRYDVLLHTSLRCPYPDAFLLSLNHRGLFSPPAFCSYTIWQVSVFMWEHENPVKYKIVLTSKLF